MGTVLHIDIAKEKYQLAEQIVVASIMVDNEILPAVEVFLLPDDFSNPGLRHIYDAILSLQDAGNKFDLVGVTEHLHRDGKLQGLGGPGYLVDLCDNVGSSSQAEHYAKIIKENSIARQYAELAKRQAAEAEATISGKGNVFALIDKHESELLEIVKTYIKTDNMSPLGDIVAGEIESYNKQDTDHSGLSVGYYDLDSMLTGLHPGELILLAARPGVGKTGLALNIAVNCQIPVGFFSIEMAKEELVRRYIAMESGVNSMRLRSGKLTWDDLSDVKRILSSPFPPIYINDKGGSSIQEIRSGSRYLAGKKGAKLIIIDYVQLIRTSQGRSREQEISEVSAKLKTMAKELNIPVLALAQLNRKIEERDTGKPKLSDLRESGSLEQVADAVVFLYPDKSNEHTVNFLVAKNRNGRTGEGKLHYNKTIQKFYDHAE